MSIEKRQTVLFSATQTRNVEDLARISLRKTPLYVGVDDHKDTSTVEGLEQVKIHFEINLTKPHSVLILREHNKFTPVDQLCLVIFLCILLLFRVMWSALQRFDSFSFSPSSKRIDRRRSWSSFHPAIP